MADAAAGFNQHVLAGGFDDKTIECRFNAVQIVAGLELRPERFGDDAEHGTAIPPIGAGAHGCYAHAVKVQRMQVRFNPWSQPWTSFLPRSNRSLASSTIFLP